MTKVLIAVDDTDASVNAVRVAHSLFGPAAEYLVVNVAQHLGGQPIGYAYSLSMPIMETPEVAMDEYADALEMAAHQAEGVATQTAETAGVTDPVVGEVGDPASAIMDAATEHEADVIVVGSHERSWFSRLLNASVSETLVKRADVPVLVVK
jgi:nucleotide-binding universal stress UspA family protein